MSEPKPAFLGGPDKRWYLVKDVKAREEKVDKEKEKETLNKEREKEKKEKEKEVGEEKKEKAKAKAKVEKEKEKVKERKLKLEEKEKEAAEKMVSLVNEDMGGPKGAKNRGGEEKNDGVTMEKKSGKRKIAGEEEKVEEAEVPRKKTTRRLEADNSSFAGQG